MSITEGVFLELSPTTAPDRPGQEVRYLALDAMPNELTEVVNVGDLLVVSVPAAPNGEYSWNPQEREGLRFRYAEPKVVKSNDDWRDYWTIEVLSAGETEVVFGRYAEGFDNYEEEPDAFLSLELDVRDPLETGVEL